MPTVVITGITGFLAAHVAVKFLQNGWHVRGTLRSLSKEPALKAMPEFAPYIASGHLTFNVTGSLEDGNYTEAIQGVDAVVHTASPVEFTGTDFREHYLAPAVNGTKSVLEAAAKEESVKAVVMTSTYGAVGDHRQHPTEQVGRTLTEDDWNPYTLEELDEMSQSGSTEGNGTFIAPYLYYMGAKKYAEVEAWEVQKRTAAKWSLATMNCVMIWGPPIQPLTSLTHGGMSTEYPWSILKGPKETPQHDVYFPYYVDVRDAAEAHYQAVVRQSQGRFILAARPYDYQEMSDMAKEWYPELKDRVIEGTPGKYMYQDPGVYTLDNSKSQKELGITYRPKEATFRDAFDRILALEKGGLN